MTNLVHIFENTREIAHKPEVFVSNHEWELAVFIRFFFSFFFLRYACLSYPVLF